MNRAYSPGSLPVSLFATNSCSTGDSIAAFPSSQKMEQLRIIISHPGQDLGHSQQVFVFVRWSIAVDPPAAFLKVTLDESLAALVVFLPGALGVDNGRRSDLSSEFV
jgi:hypothetical protein